MASFQSNQEGNHNYVDLFDCETSWVMMDTLSISTVTFFDHDGVVPTEYLRNRVESIISLNPWLTGRLVTVKRKVVLRYTPEYHPSELLEPYFTVTSQPLYNQGMVGVGNQDFCVKKGNQCVDYDEPLFRVTVVLSTNKNNRFALVFSISHIIADGYSFYTMYSMLEPTKVPRSMIIDRDFEKRRQIEKHTVDDDKVIKSFGMMAIMTFRLLFLTKRANVFHRKLNCTWVESEKIAYKQQSDPKFLDSGVDCDSGCDYTGSGESKSSVSLNISQPSFVSTNDILTSEYFRSTDCDMGAIAINYRNRIDGLTDEFFGNYEGVVCYQREDFATPQLIRASLSNGRFKRCITGSLTCRAKIALLSNWTSFYTPLCFDSCRELQHKPFSFPEKIPPAAALLYMADKDTPAFLTMEPTSINMNRMYEKGAVGACVDTVAM